MPQVFVILALICLRDLSDAEPGGSEGHMARDCDQNPSTGSGGGGWGSVGGGNYNSGGRECYKCSFALPYLF